MCDDIGVNERVIYLPVWFYGLVLAKETLKYGLICYNLNEDFDCT